MIELFTSMYSYTEMQCFVDDKPALTKKEVIRIVRIEEPPNPVVAIEELKPEYHIPSRMHTIKSFSQGDYRRSIFNPLHPNAIKTNYKELQ
jgi:hypothetical protein